eukprot:15484446-Alexandrium_andersonii.AAC.1
MPAPPWQGFMSERRQKKKKLEGLIRRARRRRTGDRAGTPFASASERIGPLNDQHARLVSCASRLVLRTSASVDSR